VLNEPFVICTSLMLAALCDIETGRIIGENGLAVAVRDNHPVTPLHTLAIPRRHATTWFDLSVPEQRAIGLLLDTMRKQIATTDATVSGFNASE